MGVSQSFAAVTCLLVVITENSLDVLTTWETKNLGWLGFAKWPRLTLLTVKSDKENPHWRDHPSGILDW